MLSAHCPSGYLLGSLLEKKKNAATATDIPTATDTKASTAWVLPAVLIGAMAPDLDMLYFHFVSFGQTHHHMFISHWPLAWLALGVPTLLLVQLKGGRRLRNAAIAFFAGVGLHLLLDSVAAPIFWLMPFAPGRVELVTVPASYSHWILSYLLHWTFLIELSIWAAAIGMYWQRRHVQMKSVGA